MSKEQRSLKNLHLTKRFHWSYFGGWLTFTIALLLLLEGLVVTILSSLDPQSLPFSPLGAIGASILAAILCIGALIGLGRFSAHRIGGVHLRTESVLRKVAQGELGERLKYRADDDLEDVESAFDRLLLYLKSDQAPIAEEVSPDPSRLERGRQRRHWRNMQMTSRYHLKYMAVWVLVSLALVVGNYGAAMLYLYYRYYQFDSSDPTALSLVLTALAVGLAGAVVWHGYLTAHRLAGVHLKLASVFDRLSRGERDVQLKFRAYDKLDSLEQAYQAMIAWIGERDKAL